jgi:hypothetical protein
MINNQFEKTLTNFLKIFQKVLAGSKLAYDRLFFHVFGISSIEKIKYLSLLQGWHVICISDWHSFDLKKKEGWEWEQLHRLWNVLLLG